jgi:hypothetical protein
MSLIDWLCWSETMSQNCGNLRAYCLSPGDIWAWTAMVMMMMMMTIMMPAGDNSWLVHQSSPVVLPAETSGESRRNGWSENFAYQCLKYLKGYLTCRKILLGTSGFTSHSKEGVLRIFIALKNPSPRPDLNLRPLSPAASTITTTPPRRPIWDYFKLISSVNWSTNSVRPQSDCNGNDKECIQKFDAETSWEKHTLNTARWDKNNLRDMRWKYVVYLTTLFQQRRPYRVERKGDKWMTAWKWFWRKRSWPDFKVLSQNSLRGTEINHENPQTG